MSHHRPARPASPRLLAMHTLRDSKDSAFNFDLSCEARSSTTKPHLSAPYWKDPIPLRSRTLGGVPAPSLFSDWKCSDEKKANSSQTHDSNTQQAQDEIVTSIQTEAVTDFFAQVQNRFTVKDMIEVFSTESVKCLEDEDSISQHTIPTPSRPELPEFDPYETELDQYVLEPRNSPKILTFPLIVKETKIALYNDINGMYIKASSKTGNVSAARDIILIGMENSMESFHQLMQPVLKTLQYVTKLRIAQNEFHVRERSPALRENVPMTLSFFMLGVQNVLNAKLKYVDDLELHNDPGLLTKIRKYCAAMNIIYKVAKTALTVFEQIDNGAQHLTNRLAAAHLLNVLLTCIKNHALYELDLNTLIELYAFSLRRYLDIADRWLQEGEIMDQRNEFLLTHSTPITMNPKYDIWESRSLSIEALHRAEDLRCLQPSLPFPWRPTPELVVDETLEVFDSIFNEQIQSNIATKYAAVSFERAVQTLDKPQRVVPEYDEILSIFRDQILPIGEQMYLLQRMDELRGVNRHYFGNNKESLSEEFFNICKLFLTKTKDLALSIPKHYTFELAHSQERFDVVDNSDWIDLDVECPLKTYVATDPEPEEAEASETPSIDQFTVKSRDIAMQLSALIKRRVLIGSDEIKRTLREDHHLESYLNMFRAVVYLNTENSANFIKEVIASIQDRTWPNIVRLSISLYQVYRDELIPLEHQFQVNATSDQTFATNEFDRLNEIMLTLNVPWPISIFTNRYHILIYNYFFTSRLKVKLAVHKLRDLNPSGRHLSKTYTQRSLQMLQQIKWVLEKLFYKIEDYCFNRSFSEATTLYNLQIEKARSMDAIYKADFSFLQRMFHYVVCIIDTPVGATGMVEVFENVSAFINCWDAFFADPSTFVDDLLLPLYKKVLLTEIYVEKMQSNVILSGIKFVRKNRQVFHSEFMKLFGFDWESIEFIPEYTESTINIWSMIHDENDSKFEIQIPWKENYNYKPIDEIDYFLRLQQSNFDWDISVIFGRDL